MIVPDDSGLPHNGRILGERPEPTMKISMYDACVPPGIRMMNNLAAVLEKAIAHAEAKKIEPEVLVNARLAPDRVPLLRQVQIASDAIKADAARVAAVAPAA